REKAAALSEKNAAELRHEQAVEDLKGSYSDALEWAYSVKPIPREHWLEKGYTEEYADGLGFCRTPFWREFCASNADPDTTPERKLSQVAESRSRKGRDSPDADVPAPPPRRPLNFPAPSTIQRYAYGKQHALLVGSAAAYTLGPGPCPGPAAHSTSQHPAPTLRQTASPPARVASWLGGGVHVGHGAVPPLLPAEVGKSGVQEDEEEMESANVDAGGYEDWGCDDAVRYS
ncbi:hypothetical protein THAOC_02558, partial [Thalassiosira oceanica]